jgi:hypothetical protein
MLPVPSSKIEASQPCNVNFCNYAFEKAYTYNDIILFISKKFLSLYKIAIFKFSIDINII